MIQLDKITKQFTHKNEAHFALKEVSLSVPQGEIFALIGKSGSGKSTLLRCINLMESPTSGIVSLNGVPLSNLSSRELRATRRKIGFIFQHFNLLSQATVFKNIALPLEGVGFSKAEIKQRVNHLLEVTELTQKGNYYPDQLSGGQKQRVAIARALANNPSVLLCDEATSALDTQTAKSILNLLKKINEDFKVTIIMVTHQLEVAKYLCHRVGVLDKGELIEVYSSQEFFKEGAEL